MCMQSPVNLWDCISNEFSLSVFRARLLQQRCRTNGLSTTLPSLPICKSGIRFTNFFRFGVERNSAQKLFSFLAHKATPYWTKILYLLALRKMCSVGASAPRGFPPPIYNDDSANPKMFSRLKKCHLTKKNKRFSVVFSGTVLGGGGKNYFFEVSREFLRTPSFGG